MADFSATDAALSGFRFVRERPRIVLAWAAIQLVVSFAFSAILILVLGPQMQKMMAFQGGGPLNPAQTQAEVMGIWSAILPLYALMIPLMLVFYSVIFALFSRVTLRPADDRFAYLRLGRDELRQGLLILLETVVWLGAEIVFGVVMAIFFVIIGLAVAALKGHVGTEWIMHYGILAAIGVLLVFFSVRLSLASPLTFDTGRVNLFGSWKLTRGHFWKLLGCYLLTGGLALLVMLLTMIVGGALAALVGGGMGVFRTLFRPEAYSLAYLLSAPRLAMSLVGAVGGALMGPVMMMPAPAIYKALTAAAGEGISSRP